MKDKAREHPCLNATEEEMDTLVLTTVIGGQRSHTAHRFDHIIFFKFLSSVPEDVAFGLGCQKSRYEPTPTRLPPPRFNHPRGLQRSLIRTDVDIQAAGKQHGKDRADRSPDTEISEHLQLLYTLLALTVACACHMARPLAWHCSGGATSFSPGALLLCAQLHW